MSDKGMMGLERIAMPINCPVRVGWQSSVILSVIRAMNSVGSLNATRDGGRNGAQFFGFLFDVGHQGLG